MWIKLIIVKQNILEKNEEQFVLNDLFIDKPPPTPTPSMMLNHWPAEKACVLDVGCIVSSWVMSL